MFRLMVLWYITENSKNKEDTCAVYECDVHAVVCMKQWHFPKTSALVCGDSFTNQLSYSRARAVHCLNDYGKRVNRTERSKRTYCLHVVRIGMSFGV